MSSPPFVLAVDIGGTTLKVGLFDSQLAGHLLKRIPTETSRGPQAVVDQLTRLVQACLSQAARQWGECAVAALAVATPGLVDTTAGVVHFAGNLGFVDLPMARYMSQVAHGLPVTVLNDAHAGALGEVSAGALAGQGLYVALGTGIGGCLVGHDGHVTLGSRGHAGEIGHMVIDPNGPKCGCGGRGHLESLASGAAIARMYKSKSNNSSSTSARVVAERLAEGDQIASDVWQVAVAALAIAIANVTTLLDPAFVVLGGDVSASGRLLLEPLQTHAARLLPFRSLPEIVTSRHPDVAGLLGAASAAWRSLSNCQSEPMKG